MVLLPFSFARLNLAVILTPGMFPPVGPAAN